MKANPAIRCVLAIVLYPFVATCHSLADDSNSVHLRQRLRNLQSISIIRLELINAQNDTIVTDLFNGQVINMKNITALTGPNFNINAVTSAGSVSSVIFGYNGNPNIRKESSGPYAFCGNNGPDFYKCAQLTYGVHEVTATAYSSGIPGPTLSINFTIISGSTPNPVLPPVPPPTVPTPVTMPVNPPIPLSVPVPIPAPVSAPQPISAPFTAPIPATAPVMAPITATTPVTVPSPAAAPQSILPAIHTLRLMYTGVSPSAPVLNLTFDTVNVIDLAALNLPSGKFNIDVLVGPGTKSVTFSNGRTETSAPLAYCGNSGNNFYDCDDLVEGTNVTVSITAYPEGGGFGSPILTRSTTIQIIRPLPPVAPTPPTVAPVAAPIIPPVPGCPLPKVRIHCKEI